MAHYTIVCKIVIFIYGISFSTCYVNNLSGQPGKGYVLEVMVGTPPQKFNVLVDTGSSNLAIAAANSLDINRYFNDSRSTTLSHVRDEVIVRYSFGTWSGKLVSDVVFFPTLNSVPQVRCDVALIGKEKDFFMRGADWQGILGIAYPAIASPDADVLSWIDSLQTTNRDKTMAFSLTLCGAVNGTENAHYGSFEILNNFTEKYDDLLTATVLKNWFYEIIMTGLSVAGVKIDIDCRILNTDVTIVDSGTTNLRLPEAVFHKLVSVLNSTARVSGAIVKDDFWEPNKVSCWPQEQDWNVLPMISIDIASSDSEYFTISIPGKSYIHKVYDLLEPTDPNEEPEFCYKLGLDPVEKGSILGVTALEGFQVIFNRTRHTVGFRKADCGPAVTIAGPFVAKFTNESLLDRCANPAAAQVSMLKIANYIIAIILIVSSVMAAIVHTKWKKETYLRSIIPVPSVSLSQTSLINKNA